MAVDIGEERLKINDVEVFIEESPSKIVVWESGKVLITLEKKKAFQLHTFGITYCFTGIIWDLLIVFKYDKAFS